MRPARGSMNHLRLSVRDPADSEAFYTALLPHLDYAKVHRPDGVAWVRTASAGNLEWLIFTEADPDKQLPVQEPESPGLHHLALNADSRALVDRIHASLADRGARVLTPPGEYDYEPGYYAVFFQDPDGFKIEVVHSPSQNP